MEDVEAVVPRTEGGVEPMNLGQVKLLRGGIEKLGRDIPDEADVNINMGVLRRLVATACIVVGL